MSDRDEALDRQKYYDEQAKQAIPVAPEHRDFIMMSDEKLAYIRDNVNYVLAKRESERKEKGCDEPNRLQGTIKTVPAPSVVASDSGATSSHFSARYDLIPRSLIETAVITYTFGANKHGERGYQRGLADRKFILDRLNHIQEHFDKLRHPSIDRYIQQQGELRQNGEVNDEACSLEAIRQNISAMLWGLGFLTEVLEHDRGRQIFQGIVSEGRVKNRERPMPMVSDTDKTDKA